MSEDQIIDHEFLDFAYSVGKVFGYLSNDRFRNEYKIKNEDYKKMKVLFSKISKYFYKEQR